MLSQARQSRSSVQTKQALSSVSVSSTEMSQIVQVAQSGEPTCSVAGCSIGMARSNGMLMLGGSAMQAGVLEGEQICQVVAA